MVDCPDLIEPHFLVFWGTERFLTERYRYILRNKSQWKCTSFLRDVINAIYFVKDMQI